MALEAALRSFASQEVLKPPAHRHMTVRRFETQLAAKLSGEGLDVAERVAVLRDPLERLGSWYRYRRRPEIAGKAESTAEISFADFVEALLEEDPPAFAKVGFQDRFVQRQDGDIGVDHLFDYARPQRLTDFLSARFERKIVLARINSSPPADLDLPEELEGRLRAARHTEFALYDRVAKDGYLRTRVAHGSAAPPAATPEGSRRR